MGEVLAVLCIGHGSKARGAKAGMYLAVEWLRRRWPRRFVEAAFLELNRPTIPEGMDCASRRARPG